MVFARYPAVYYGDVGSELDDDDEYGGMDDIEEASDVEELTEVSDLFLFFLFQNRFLRDPTYGGTYVRNVVMYLYVDMVLIDSGRDSGLNLLFILIGISRPHSRPIATPSGIATHLFPNHGSVVLRRKWERGRQ